MAVNRITTVGEIMANSKQAKKRARQSIKRRALNMSHRSAMRTAIKKTRKFIENKKLDDAKAAFVHMGTVIDRMAGKGIIHKNTAARHKTRLSQQIKKLQSA